MAHGMTLYVRFLLGESSSKRDIIGTVLRLHVAAEDVLFELLTSQGHITNERDGFKKKLNKFKDEDWYEPFRVLNDIRNLCAHRRVNFYGTLKQTVIPLCHQLIHLSKELTGEHFTQWSQNTSLLDAAVAALLDYILRKHSLKPSGGIELDGLYLPGEKTLDDMINELI